MEDRSTHDDLYSLDDRHQNDKLNWKLYEDVTKKHMRETAYYKQIFMHASHSMERTSA